MKSVARFSMTLTGVIFFLFSLCSTTATNFTVTMAGTTFNPATLTIAVGDRVTWTNTSTGVGSTHTSTRGDPLCSTNGFGGTFWNSGDMASHATFSFTFTNFAAGSYTYLCIQHCSMFGMKGTIVLTNPASITPTVSITNPPSGAKFRAPTNLVLMASASESGGSITNVQFFSGGSLLGNVTTLPFNFSLNSLAAGNYSFTAKASDVLGVTATSSVVNVFVLTNATLSSPTHLGNGQFQFTVQGISNQTYTTEASSNLAIWFPLSTNVAPANNFDVLDPSATNGIRFYRVRQDF